MYLRRSRKVSAAWQRGCQRAWLSARVQALKRRPCKAVSRNRARVGRRGRDIEQTSSTARLKNATGNTSTTIYVPTTPRIKVQNSVRIAGSSFHRTSGSSAA